MLLKITYFLVYKYIPDIYIEIRKYILYYTVCDFYVIFITNINLCLCIHKRRRKRQSLTQILSTKCSHKTMVFSRGTFHKCDIKKIVYRRYQRRYVCATIFFIFMGIQNWTVTNLKQKTKTKTKNKFISLVTYFAKIYDNNCLMLTST